MTEAPLKQVRKFGDGTRAFEVLNEAFFGAENEVQALAHDLYEAFRARMQMPTMLPFDEHTPEIRNAYKQDAEYLIRAGYRKRP
jgi:hypothetical protein